MTDKTTTTIEDPFHGRDYEIITVVIPTEYGNAVIKCRKFTDGLEPKLYIDMSAWEKDIN